MDLLKTSIIVLFTAFSSLSATAQVDNPDQMGMVTGSSTGTYIKFGKDMASVTESEGLKLLIKESQGSLSNIRRMVSKENAAIGIVQSDVLGFLTRSPDEAMRRVASRLRLIFPFYNEEVHLYARADIKSFAELQGKRVVVGSEGSGNWLTSNNLLHLMGVEPGERLNLDPAAGATAVLTGQADAMFYVAGKPVKLFTTIAKLKENPKYQELAKNVHMVPLDDPKMLEEYVSASLGTADYSWLETDVPTIAVKAMLVGFDFSQKKSAYYTKRCGELKALGTAIRSNIDQLRETGHPKWNEVNLDQEIGLWERDQCSFVDMEKIAREKEAAKKVAEAKLKTQEEAKRRADEAKIKAEEAKLKADEEAKLKAEEAKRVVEEEAKRKVEEAKLLAEEEVKRKAQEVKRLAEEEAKRKADAEKDFLIKGLEECIRTGKCE